MIRHWLPLLLAVELIGACSKKNAEPEGPRPTTTQAPSPVEAPAPASAVTDAATDDDPNLVLPSDLEEKAKEEISATNLEKQLDVLEKEIGSGG